MQIGMVGLGRMGASMARRLMKAGHQCVVFDTSPANVEALVAQGASGATSLQDLADRLAAPRVLWLMLPAAVTGKVAHELAALMQPGDILIDGGNSNYRDAVDFAVQFDRQGLGYIDVGTSGGVWGETRGYCLMIGGPERLVQYLDPVFAALAPGGEGDGTASRGYLHCGPSGAGHFVKMVHNGIEYGLMAAYAEGLNILRSADAGSGVHSADAETAPLEEPQYYRFDIDIAAVAEVWRHGSVIGSWLLDLTATALREDPALSGYGGRVSDSGEGRWTLKAAIDTGTPAPVLAAALFERFGSRGATVYADKVLSAMRHAFGGHVEKPQ